MVHSAGVIQERVIHLVELLSHSSNDPSSTLKSSAVCMELEYFPWDFVYFPLGARVSSPIPQMCQLID